MKSKILFYVTALLLSVLLLHCKGDKNFVFPYVRIDMTILIPIDMANVGNFDSKIYPDEGFGGVLIFRVSENEFFAFDMACTRELSDSCIVSEFEGSQIIWQCKCCNSQYTIDPHSGCYVSKGPTSYPLKQYRTYIDGDFLYVTN